MTVPTSARSQQQAIMCTRRPSTYLTSACRPCHPPDVHFSTLHQMVRHTCTRSTITPPTPSISISRDRRFPANASQFCRAEKTACIVPLQTVEEIRGPDDLADYMEGQFGLTNHETVKQDDATGSVQCMSITMGSPPESLRLRDTSVNSVMSVDSDNEGTRLAASLYGNRMGSQVHFSL
jgi:hypothetical protein